MTERNKETMTNRKGKQNRKNMRRNKEWKEKKFPNTNNKGKVTD